MSYALATDSTLYLTDLRVARLTVTSSISVPGEGDGGAVDAIANAETDGARVFRSTVAHTATFRRLAAGSDSLTIVETSDDVVTIALARAVIGSGASAASTSVALGPTAAAAGSYAAALGPSAAASGSYAIASGFSSSASASYAIAAGYSAAATAVNALAAGYDAEASGSDSTAVGANATASAVESLAAGKTAGASASYATAIGARAAVAVGATGASAFGYSAAASIPQTINFSGVPVARRASSISSVPTGATATSLLAAPLAALTTVRWNASTSGSDKTTLVVPTGAVFFPETFRVWREGTLSDAGSGDVTISVGSASGGSDVVSAFPVGPMGTMDITYPSRVGLVATTKGLVGTIYVSQPSGTGGYFLRCALQGLLVDAEIVGEA